MVLREQLGHLGEPRYFLRNLEVKLEDDVFIPIGFINRLRRDAIAKLDSASARQRPGWSELGKHPAMSRIPILADSSASIGQPRRSPESALSQLLVEAKVSGNKSPELITLCRTFEQIETALEKGSKRSTSTSRMSGFISRRWSE